MSILQRRQRVSEQKRSGRHPGDGSESNNQYSPPQKTLQMEMTSSSGHMAKEHIGPSARCVGYTQSGMNCTVRNTAKHRALPRYFTILIPSTINPCRLHMRWPVGSEIDPGVVSWMIRYSTRLTFDAFHFLLKSLSGTPLLLNKCSRRDEWNTTLSVIIA